jgi:hypothetical protein
MMRRAAIFLLVAWLLPPLLPAGPAVAQASPTDGTASPAARPFGGSATQTRMPPTLTEPLRLMPPNASAMRSEPAPVPNRDIEAPRDRTASPLAATVEPMLLPQDRNQGMTFGREHLRDAGPDRPFENFVPGARLRIPFDSGLPNR